MLSARDATEELVNAVAAELSAGVDVAVESWMAQIEGAFADTGLTTLGRLHAVRDILERYKRLTGKTRLQYRKAC